jgi:hypothetical protein
VPQKDPFATLPDPDISTMNCNSNLSVGPHGNQTFAPGCYRNVDIKGTARLNAGIYYIDGGTFSVGAQGVVIGTGVTIILTSKNAVSDPSSIATADMNGGAQINLSAPTTGTYAGVIFYQDRRAPDGSSNTVNGNTDSFYQGAIYFPKQQVKFNGTAGMSTDCLQIVSRRVVFLGNSSISNVCPTGSGSHSFTGTAVKLIG